MIGGASMLVYVLRATEIGVWGTVAFIGGFLLALRPLAYCDQEHFITRIDLCKLQY